MPLLLDDSMIEVEEGSSLALLSCISALPPLFAVASYFSLEIPHESLVLVLWVRSFLPDFFSIFD